MTQGTSTALREQLDYYRARATEYDQWWLRLGRYDRGAHLNTQWFKEAETVAGALKKSRPSGRILELACGTGIWTEQLARFSENITALDGSAEMLAINRARLHSPKIRYLQADLFQWKPKEQFDFIFFGFWLSHVPPEKFSEFWQLVGSCLAPGGRVFFVDSRHEHTSTAKDHVLPESTAYVLRRKLNDGREFQIYKIFYEREHLTRQLHDLGWQFHLHQTPSYFLYGDGKLKGSR